ELDLEVHDREFLVMVGPSGSGKSTALRLVAGLEEATSGRIFIGDRLVNEVAPKDRDVAMVFQSYALYPHMNVYDNLAHPLQLLRAPQLVYDHPANLFVAGFIGSPSMNFFDANLVARDEALYIEGPGFEVLVPPERARNLDRHAGRDIILGIRPEHLYEQNEV